MIRISVFAISFLFFSSLAQAAWNRPHQGTLYQNTYYTAFVEQPKTLDPARSYSSDELQIIQQIYEPPLQYNYLKRPYQLEPLTAEKMPEVTYYNQEGKRILLTPSDVKEVAYTEYDIYIKPHIYYQPHPALAKNKKGEYLYLYLPRALIDKAYSLAFFEKTGTRELTAEDYVYEIKRLASPTVQSPIFGMMSEHIKGFVAFERQMTKIFDAAKPREFINLNNYPMSGAQVISRYHYRVVIKGVYPQFNYWLAMTFFCPIPWEADAFYSQPGMEEHNLNFNWYPIGTGPYMMIKNDPNKEMVLASNPNFHYETHPLSGESGDAEKGYLDQAGKQLPFIKKVIFVLDKESIPRWNKFLQGYYDRSGVSSDSFDQAIKLDKNGNPILTGQMKKKGITLETSVAPTLFYIGFNMLDPVVGGYSEKKQKLRQAISIILDYEEYISIFLNGRGVPAQGPIPAGIFGYLSGKPGINPYVYEWFQGKPKRHSIEYAKKLLVEAGYPNGIDPETMRPLLLNYDVATTGDPNDKANFDWLRKQFSKVGIKLNIRATLYNRFRDIVRSGKAQIFSWGWSADYPDPENFLFLLYSPNGQIKFGGENTTNYQNSVVDKLFEEIKNMPDGSLRQQKINELLEIIRKDSPMVWGFHPINFVLSHQWMAPSKPNAMAGNTLKYQKIDIKKREELQDKWNNPVMWPIVAILIFLILMCIPLIVTYWRREKKPTIKIYKKE